MYWVLMAFLLVVALAFVLVPLYRNSRTTGGDHPDVAVYKAQLAELDEDISEGRLSAEEAESARLEIQRRLLKAAGREENTEKMGKVTPAQTILVLLVILACGSLYHFVGTPGMPDFPARQADDGPINEDRQTLIDYVAKIRARLAEDSDSKVGWMALGQFEGRLGRYPEAAAALERAWELDPENFDLMLMYMESLVVLSEGRMSPAALLMLEKAMAKNPNHPGVQYYVGLTDYQAGDKKQALEIWQAIRRQSKPDAPWMPQVNAVIAMTERELGRTQVPVAPNIDREQMEAVQQMSPEGQQQMIRSMVQRLADRLADNPDDGAGWQRLGNAYKVLGERDKAIDAFQKALKYSPERDKPALEKELEKLENSL